MERRRQHIGPDEVGEQPRDQPRDRPGQDADEDGSDRIQVERDPKCRPDGLAKEGITNARLETTARVKLEQDGDGFTVTRSDLALTADVPDLDEQRLRALAEEAEKNCPISKLLKAEIGLTVTVGAGAAA